MNKVQERNENEFQTLEGKTAIITGGTTGIGRATALLLASKGVDIILFGRHQKELDDTMRDFKARGLEDKVKGLTGDASNKEDIERIFNQADESLNKLDILINNAALAFGSIEEGSYEEWQYIVQTNLLGYMAFVNEAVKRMEKNQKGHIINIGSMSADVREKSSSVYVATKAGIQGFSEALRKEVNAKGIKITLIEPGAVGTDMQPVTVSEQREKEEKLEMLKAEDIAQCVYFALIQPLRSDIVTMQVRPHMQMI